MNEKLHSVVGIDLGTTYSAVATYNTYTEQTEVISNEVSENKATVPSVVGWHPVLHKAIVGQAAKNNLAKDPQNTIIEIKREMGEDFRRETLQKFGAPESELGNPVKAHFAGEWRLPQEISALILMKMKEVAEKNIGAEIRDAVITVPAYFTEKQKKATKEAALLAGLYPRQLIPEPTAAAICYGVDKMEEDRKIYLVYDLGGGTFDVSIIEVKEAKIDVVATSGDPRLGGGDFDDAITEWAVSELAAKHNITSVDASARARIKFNAEQAKIRLSTNSTTDLVLVDVFPKEAPVLTLEREVFEKLIVSLLKKAISYVNTAINMAEEKKGIQREKVDAILLVGGSSKIPVVKKMLLDYFGKEDSFVKSDLNPDEVVARGAAIMASRFAPSPAPFDITKEVDNTLTKAGVEDVHVQLITEHSLGVGVQDNIFSKIIDQGSNIPIEITKSGYTNPGPVDHVDVLVYQGEGKKTFENTLIGEMKLGPMDPQPANFHKFDVTFKLDENGLLSVFVNHINTGKTYQAKFEHKTGVGGTGALNAIHEKLLRLYADHASLENNQVPPAQSETYTPPPPASAYAPPQPSQPTPPPSTPTVAPKSAAEPAVPSPAGLIEPTVEIPAEFRSIARRVRKKIAATNNPALLKAFNAFATALNNSSPEEQIQELGDAMDEVYLKMPDGPAIIEPATEVPAQFKSIVRRAQKQLLDGMQPDLLAAFNALTTALNAGAAESDLEELGDKLADVYQDLRK